MFIFLYLQHLLNRMHITIDVEKEQSVLSRIILVKNKNNYFWLVFIGFVYLFVCKDDSRWDELLVLYFNKPLITGMGHRVNNWKFIGTNGNTEFSVFWTDHISILLSRIIPIWIEFLKLQTDDLLCKLFLRMQFFGFCFTLLLTISHLFSILTCNTHEA